MSILFGFLGFLAIGAWLSYSFSREQRSGLHLLFALGCGAVLGLAAIVAATLTIDIDPARLARPLGMVFSVLVAVLVLSAVGQLVAALFSPAVRKSVATHEVAHAFWFGAAMSIGAFTYLYRVDLRTFLVAPNPWTIRGLQRPRAHGRNLVEWLPVLRTDTDRTESPLRIVRVIYNDEPECDAVEVPLSWDLMVKNDLIHAEPRDEGGRPAAYFRAAHLALFINDGHGSVTGPLCWRADNGNCLLRYHHRYLNPGTNSLKVEFGLSAGDNRLSETGPPTPVELNARGLVRVMDDTKWEKLGLAMDSLRGLRPKWRTRDIESGLTEEPNDYWWGFCMSRAYANIEWLEIEVTSPEQDAAVSNALKALHVPGEKTEHGYRVFGYAAPGKAVPDIE